MITDRINNCPFCLNPIPWISDFCRECRCDGDKNWMWIFYDDVSNKDTPTAINIRVENFQLHWSIKRNYTWLIDVSKSMKEIVNIPYLLDFPLDVETIKNKIQTLLTFM